MGQLPVKVFKQIIFTPDHLEPVTHQENCRRARLFLVKRTHCPAGHEYTPENTYTNPSTGYSYCKTCKNIKMRGKRDRN